MRKFNNNKNNFLFNNEADDLDVFVFDTFEILNSAFFNDGNIEKQKQFIEGIIESLETNFVAVDTKKRELIRCSKIRKELNIYIADVFKEYYSNPVFESHCRNQIFKNLQPKLKTVGVVNNKSNLTSLLAKTTNYEVSNNYGIGYCHTAFSILSKRTRNK